MKKDKIFIKIGANLLTKNAGGGGVPFLMGIFL